MTKSTKILDIGKLFGNNVTNMKKTISLWLPWISNERQPIKEFTMTQACPISYKSVDANQARVHAVLTALLLLIFVLGDSIWMMLLVTYDFAVRLFVSTSFSPLFWFSRELKKRLGIAERKSDAAPKFFAAWLGLVMAAAIWLLLGFGLTGFAYALGAVFAGCAILEAVFDYCIGCKIYMILRRFQLI